MDFEMKKALPLLQMMNKQYLLNTARIAISDPEIFSDLIEVALSDRQPESKRAVWTLDMINDTDSHLIKPFIPVILLKLPEFKEERNQGSFLHILSEYDLSYEPDNLGLLVDFCINILHSDQVQMYMKLYSMLTLKNICSFYPELCREVVYEIQNSMDSFDREYLKRKAKEIIKVLETNQI